MSHPEDTKYPPKYIWDDKGNLKIDVVSREIVNPEGKKGIEVYTETSGHTESFCLSFSEDKIGDLSEVHRYLSQTKDKEEASRNLRDEINRRYNKKIVDENWLA